MSDDTPETNTPNKPMGFFDHLEALRWTLMKCAITFAIFAGLIGFFLKETSGFLLWPLERVRANFPDMPAGLITESPLAVFSVILNVCVIGGLLLSLPFFMIHVAQFISPALTQRERRTIVPVAISAFILFLIGACFGYFLIVPSAIEVSMELSKLMGFQVLWSADSYYSLLMWLVLGLGGIFEFPLLILLLIHLRMVTVAKFRSLRRYIIVVIFIVAAIVTPTPDPVTQTLVAIPMWVLFELALIVGAIVERRRAAREALEEN